MKNSTMARLFKIPRVCHKALRFLFFLNYNKITLIGKKLRYGQEVASLDYALRCGLTL